jgi:hypothetical protein
MATEEKPEKLEETAQESQPKTEKTTPPKEEKSTGKPVYKFPHQVLMERMGKKDADVDKNTKDYLSDFNDFLKHVKMSKASVEKKGKEWTLPETKKNKLLRLSKSICQSLQVVIDEEEDKKNAIKEAKEVEVRKKQFLIQKRRESSAKIKAQIDADKQRLKEEQELAEKKKKEEEEDTIGFWF